MDKESKKALKMLARAARVFTLTDNHDEHGQKTLDAAWDLVGAAYVVLGAIASDKDVEKWDAQAEKKFFKDRPDWAFG